MALLTDIGDNLKKWFNSYSQGVQQRYNTPTKVAFQRKQPVKVTPPATPKLGARVSNNNFIQGVADLPASAKILVDRVPYAVNTLLNRPKDAGNIVRNSPKDLGINIPGAQTFANFAANAGQAFGQGLSNANSGMLTMRAAQNPWDRVKGAARTAYGTGQAVAPLTPLFQPLNLLSSAPDTNIKGLNELQRGAVGVLQGITQNQDLAPNIRREESIKFNLPEFLGGEEVGIDPAMDVGRMIGFVKNPTNARLFKLTEKIFPAGTLGGGADLKRWLAVTGFRGSVEDILIALDDLPDNASTAEKVQFLLANAAQGAVSEIVGRGTLDLGSVSIKKLGGTEFITNVFDQLKEFRRRSTIPLTKFNPRTGKQETKPIWRWYIEDQRGGIDFGAKVGKPKNPAQQGGETITLYKGKGRGLDINASNMNDYARKLKESADVRPKDYARSYTTSQRRASEYGDVTEFVVNKKDIMPAAEYQALLESINPGEVNPKVWQRADKYPTILSEIKKRGYKGFEASTSWLPDSEVVLLDDIAKVSPPRVAQQPLGDISLYHGSNTRFDKFDVNRFGTGEGGDKFGRGAYLTDNKGLADFYANAVSKKDFITDYKDTGIFGTPEPVFAKNADQLAKQKAVVNNFIAKNAKMLDSQTYKVDEQFKKAFAKSLEDRGFSSADAMSEVNRALEYARSNSSKINNYRGELEYLLDHITAGDAKGTQRIVDLIKQKGFDGVKYASDKSYEGAGGFNYVFYNTEKLLSPQQPSTFSKVKTLLKDQRGGIDFGAKVKAGDILEQLDIQTPKVKEKPLSFVDNYIKSQTTKQSKAAAISDSFDKLVQFKNEFKSKFVDETTAISDVLNSVEKQGKVKILPRSDVRIQIDRVLRANSIATQFLKDNNFVKIVKEVPDLQRFNQYLIAKHALDVGKQGIETGRRADLDARLVKELSNEYEPFAQALRQYQDKLLDYKVASGFITPDLAQALRKQYPNYVPLNRIFSELEEGTMRIPTGGGGVSSVSTQNVLKRLKGSEREIKNPLESILEATGVAFKEGERNKAARMLISYKDLPDNPFGLKEITDQKIGGKYTISAFIDGKKRTFETLPAIAEAAKGLDAQQFGLIGQLFAVPTRILKLGATGINVPFLAANLARDQMFSAITSQKSLKTSLANPKVFGKALFAVLKHGDDYDSWVRQGGAFTSFDISRNRASQALGEIRGKGIIHTVTSPKQLLRAVEDIIGKTEELTRMQQYIGTRDALLKEGRARVDAEALAQQAANYNTANFARKGSWSKVLNGVLPYFSAGIAGARSLTRSAMTNPKGFTARITVALFLPTAISTAWNLADPSRKEVYDDIAEYEKDNNLIVIPPNPTQDENGYWNIIKIPVTPGLSNLMRIVRRQVEGVNGLNPQTVISILGDVGTAVTSLDFTEPRKLTSSLTPQAVKPLLETQLNRNLFTGREIVPFYMKNELPENQVFSNTSGTAREIGRILNTSPMFVENAIQTSMAGVGRQALNTSDRFLNQMGLIPDEQVGGRSILEDIQNRFAKARGGEVERKAEEESQKIINESTRRYEPNIFQKLLGQQASASTSTSPVAKGSQGTIERDLGRFDSGQRETIIKNILKRDGGWQIDNGTVYYGIGQGESPNTIDLKPNTSGSGIGAFANKDYNQAQAVKIWNAEGMPEEAKAQALKILKVKPEDARYAALASYNEDVSTQYLISKSPDKETLLNNIMTGRVVGITGKQFVTNGVLDNLVDEGLLTKDEAKALKKIKLDKNGNQIGETGGGGKKRTKLSLPTPKALPALQFSKGKLYKAPKANFKAPPAPKLNLASRKQTRFALPSKARLAIRTSRA